MPRKTRKPTGMVNCGRCLQPMYVLPHRPSDLCRPCQLIEQKEQQWTPKDPEDPKSTPSATPPTGRDEPPPTG